MGYFNENKVYQIWDVTQWKIILIKDVMVDECMNQSIFLIDFTRKSNIVALVDMTTPSTIGKLE